LGSIKNKNILVYKKKCYTDISTVVYISKATMDISNLPTDVKEYIQTLQNENINLQNDNTNLRNINTDLNNTTTHLRSEYEQVKYKYDILRNIVFGKKTEKLTKEEVQHGYLFNEAEKLNNEIVTEETKEIKVVAKVKKQKKKTGQGRNPIPDWVERKETIIDIKEEEKTCGCGCKLTRIGEEKSEKMEVIPAQIVAHVTIRPKYACKACEGSSDENSSAVKIAPSPSQLIPKSLFTANSLAYFLTQKFCDGLPFYRICKILERTGIHISRSTFSNNLIEIYNRVLPVLNEIHKKILTYNAVQIDESRFRVMGEPGRANTMNSQMWVMLAGFTGNSPPIIYYHYEETRSAAFLKDWLGEYSGIIQTDAWASYNAHLKHNGKIIHAGCNVHARRKFVDILKNSKGHEMASYVVNEYAKLYRLEKFFVKKKLRPDKILRYRKRYSKVIMESLKEKLEKWLPIYPDSSYSANAIKYFLNNYDNLIQFIYHPEIPPDTNPVENSIRPFAIGRKNWLFAGSVDGAKASAGLYTLIENARLCKLDPYLYLKQLFKAIEDNPNYDPATLIPQAIQM